MDYHTNAASENALHWGCINGQDVFLITLHNKRDTRLRVSNFGATAQAFFIADGDGRLADVLLGYDALADYQKDAFYMGSVVGRYANRIAGSMVVIDGRPYTLPVRAGGYHLHGGVEGFNKKVFACTNITPNSVLFRYVSPDGEEGFPGRLVLDVRYTLTDADEWVVEYNAVCDKATLINLTQHAYFNLSGHDATSIADHTVQLSAPFYLPVTPLQVPDGSIAPVVGTPFDFTTPKRFGTALQQQHPQLERSGGYDHSFVLEQEPTPALKHAATVCEPQTGRTLNVYTTELAVHLYTGNFLDVPHGKDDAAYGPRSGFCLETQHFPDAPNHPHFPSTVLPADTPFYSKTVFHFSA